ncbi:DUF1456 family protein [Desulfuromonas acetoxidans]|uniref:Cytoplasmic protein n=1 Tax=Desulfuromonas acetoxidans (strain DSM 684 / 11070) TaxID=281689 RepID=Q1JYL3_DESA6|nr:DUF1456 family protein [Desulfuromonas acetoxidans]EAT15402.1 protein of unknown function DUF1456 [Desulfuromonas acetoxidans DSM 684]MBF0646187.1 DUF1456 family protein [Desulfuromonas acetoxidans]NVD24434.1 DUF1456 family protein [Desulfuromonas acetoxidans]NVE16618.1 DUF1456 family protein [Desulfuromonas acetoxidans]
MTYNDILRRFRYAVDLSDDAMVDIFSEGGVTLDNGELVALLRREEDEGCKPCSEKRMKQFLTGLVRFTRGEAPAGTPPLIGENDSLTNNVILKAIRIALEMQEQDMLEVFAQAGFTISRSELSALFRKKGHKNYKPCGDQLLRNFLKGLTLHNRA